MLFIFCSVVCLRIALTTGSSIVWETDNDGFLIPPAEDAAEANTTEQTLLPGQVTFSLHSRMFHGIEMYDDQGEKKPNLHILGRYPQLPLKVIIHGWMSNSSSEWVLDITDAYLKQPKKINVIVVNWGELASDSKYYPSSGSTESVGKRVGHFLNMVASKGYARSEDIHIIGHSLGAHVAGVAGHEFSGKDKIGRITGLDPAKPGYELSDLSEVLSKEDADFVDIIHSTAGTSGIFQPGGHADFYPNGGANQPGCDGFSPHIKTYLESITCSHLRVCDLYIESIEDNQAFLARKCPEGVSIPPKKDDCENSTTTTIMGESCPLSSNGIYFLETNESPPFNKDE